MVEISKLLKESVEFCLRGSSVTCRFSLPENVWQVEVDEGQINQVIQNLVLNAVQAMAMTGVLEITAENFVLGEDIRLITQNVKMKRSLIDYYKKKELI